MEDIANYCRRFTLENLDIRGQLVRLTSVWAGMHHERGYAPAVQGFLGELACVAVLVGSGLKQAGRVTLQIQRAGETGAPLAMADCTESLAVRGIARKVDGVDTFSDWAAGGTLAARFESTPLTLPAYEDTLSLRPYLPEGWEEYSFKVNFQARLIGVTVNNTHTSYQLLKGEPLTITHHGQEVTLDAATQRNGIVIAHQA